MAEIVSLIASIIQVASFGLSLSRTLKDYTAAVAGAERRLKGLDKDVDFTSRVISQLGSQLQDSQVQALVSEDTIRLAQDGVAECDAIFQAMEDVIAKIRTSGSMARWTLYFRDSKIEFLRSNLDRMRGNLNLLLGVIIHGIQLKDRPDEATMTINRAKIQELMLEKEYYTRRYLEEKRKYDELLEKINSTSTLGSLMLITVAKDGPAGAPETSEHKPDGDSEAQSVASSSSHSPGATGSDRAQSHAGPADPSPEVALNGTEAVRPSNQAEGAPSIASSRPSALPVPAKPPDPGPASAPLSVVPIPSGSGEASGCTTAFATRQRRKRDSAANAAKIATRAAGIALAVVLGAAVFPVSVPVYLVLSRRRKRLRARVEPQAQSASPPVHPPQTPWPPQPLLPPAPVPYWQPQPGPYHHVPTHAAVDYMQTTEAVYHSSDIPAELPSIAELASGPAQPELALVGQLLRDPAPAELK